MTGIISQDTTAPIENLPDQHRKALARAVSNVLSTSNAEVTFSQILDGLPIRETALDTYQGGLCPGHPLLDERFEVSAKALEQIRQLRENFDLGKVQIDHEVSVFRSSNPRGKATNMSFVALTHLSGCCPWFKSIQHTID